MTTNEKKMIVKSVQLSGYEMGTLKEAKKTLNMLFGRLTAKDNITRCYNILAGLDCLIEELDANNNNIIEFMED